MNNKEQLRALALEVGEALSEYIRVHNRIFEEAATFKSVLKNLFGRGVPMSQLLADADGLVPVWAGIQRRLADVRQAAYASMSHTEQAYLNLLSKYVDAVAQTVWALVERQRLLADGSQGGGGNPMTWDRFKDSERRYESAVEGYKAVGRELNSAAATVFD